MFRDEFEHKNTHYLILENKIFSVCQHVMKDNVLFRVEDHSKSDNVLLGLGGGVFDLKW